MTISALVESAFPQRGDRHTIRKHDNRVSRWQLLWIKRRKSRWRAPDGREVAVLFRVFCRGLDEEVRFEKRCGGETGRTLNKDYGKNFPGRGNSWKKYSVAGAGLECSRNSKEAVAGVEWVRGRVSNRGAEIRRDHIMGVGVGACGLGKTLALTLRYLGSCCSVEQRRDMTFFCLLF